MFPVLLKDHIKTLSDEVKCKLFVKLLRQAIENENSDLLKLLLEFDPVLCRRLFNAKRTADKEESSCKFFVKLLQLSIENKKIGQLKLLLEFDPALSRRMVNATGTVSRSYLPGCYLLVMSDMTLFGYSIL